MTFAAAMRLAVSNGFPDDPSFPATTTAEKRPPKTLAFAPHPMDRRSDRDFARSGMVAQSQAER
jgi:hypothetical protein